MLPELQPLFVPGVPGGPEVLVILVIVVLLFGANKIPKLARSSGEAIGEFKKGREQVEQELSEIKQEGETAAAEDETDTEYMSTETVSGEDASATEDDQ